MSNPHFLKEFIEEGFQVAISSTIEKVPIRMVFNNTPFICIREVHTTSSHLNITLLWTMICL